MLGVVSPSLKMVKIWANNTQPHVPTHRNTVTKHTHVALNNVAICCVGLLQSFGRGLRLRLGSGVDCVVTNPAPLVTEFDFSWAISAPVTHREASYQTVYFTLFIITINWFPVLLIWLRSCTKRIHDTACFQSVSLWITLLTVISLVVILHHFIWNMDNAYIDKKNQVLKRISLHRLWVL